MIFTSFLFMVLMTCVLGKNCDKLGIQIYEDLGCTPNTQVSSNVCPTRYSCKGLEPTSTKCIFKGKTYQDGEQIDSNVSHPPCLFGCTCQIGLDKSYFSCAQPRCYMPPINDSCYIKYSLDQCCPGEASCAPFDNVAKCEFGGKTYLEGQRFDPENTCLECVCQKGFKGKLEKPFCKRIECGTQLWDFGSAVQNRCAPFYDAYKNDILCCPYSWICPDGTEIITGSIKKGASCKFGNKTLWLGQKFEKIDATDSYGNVLGNVVCECVVPPLLRCLKA